MTSARVTPDDDRKRRAREEIARRNREASQPMTSPPLSPMLVQYLVGLCCLRWDPDAVDVTIGDMVYDASAKKERDIDVTVIVSEGGAPSYAFKAYEVKRESEPLDVADVEQLCIKLMDMPSVTHRAIV
jgi:hypothetical protein